MRGERSSRGGVVRRLGTGVLGLAASAALALYLTRPEAEEPRLTTVITVRVASPAAERTLDCKFYDVASRILKIGFTFAVSGRPATYAQIDQREMDGSRGAFGSADDPWPAWAFDPSDDPATLTSPDRSIRINLYAYRLKPGTVWFEAGLRSVRTLNLDGQCRTSAA